MKFRISLLVVLILGSLVLIGQQNTFDSKALEKHIKFLASDSLKGRYPGTPEDKVAAAYIRDQFEAKGLELLFEDGLQPFEVTISVKPSVEKSTISYEGTDALFGDDFGLYAFSNSTSQTAEIVFAGFGMIIDTDELQRNDYEHINATGKWAVVLKGDPDPDSNNSPFIPFSTARSKAMFARDQGAVGIILIGGSKNMPGDEHAPFVVERSITNMGLPVIDLRKHWADRHLFPDSLPTDSLESMLIRGNTNFELDFENQLSATTELLHEHVVTYNIVARLPGNDPLLKEEYLVFGAHYDHLGMGGQGSGSRVQDTVAVHYGADDNASGVAGLIELAGYFANNTENINRSLLFVAFGAEEMGLLGSRYFVNNSNISTDGMVAMINFDMIGRLSADKSVAVAGTGTAVETEDLLNRLSENSSLSLSYSPEGFGASDHASFYANDIPVMFFTTGAHSDYHTPLDTYDRINYEGMTEVLDFVASVSTELIIMSDQLSFQEAGPRERQRSGRGFKVTLGIMPDFTSSGGEGLPVGGVTKGGPADAAGMEKGDLIVGINGLSVENIYDYMNRLSQLKRGERANVDILRKGERLVLIVDL